MPLGAHQQLGFLSIGPGACGRGRKGVGPTSTGGWLDGPTAPLSVKRITNAGFPQSCLITPGEFPPGWCQQNTGQAPDGAGPVCAVYVGSYPPVMTFPGSAVGAAGATTDGVNEFGPPGVSVGAFSVGDAVGPTGAGELPEGDGAPEVLVGSGVSDGLSSPLLHPAVMAIMLTMATPPIVNPIRQDTSRDFINTPPNDAHKRACHHSTLFAPGPARVQSR